MIKIAVSLIFILILNEGCATMLNNRRQTIHLDSDPKGSEVRSNKLDHAAKTPTAFSFWKSGNVYVSLSKEGYKGQTIEVSKTTAPLFWGNLLMFEFAPVGMAIDALSGAMWNYQDTVFETLEPNQDGVAPQPLQHYSSPSSQSRWPQSSFSGPRLGFTYLNDEAIQTINKDQQRHKSNDRVGQIITQFGWHFEKRFFPKTDKEGIAFVMEAVPLIGGIESNLFFLNITGLFGIRTAGGMEFGMGPTFNGSDTSVTYAGGTTFQYGNANIPLNIAVTPWQDGTSISLLTGFNR